MKYLYYLIVTSFCLLTLCSVTSCGESTPAEEQEEINDSPTPDPNPAPEENPTPDPSPEPDPAPEEVPYVLQGSLSASRELEGKDYTEIHKYMRTYGWDYSEHPNHAENDHKDGIHCEIIWSHELDQSVFQFYIHANADVLDGDRGKKEDRQRNEMKSQTSVQWYKLNGNWDEWQRLEWKFRLPKDFRPSSNFCHIHQLKAQEGNNGAPLITITPRCNNNGSNRRMQVIHTGDNNTTSKGTIIDNLPLSDFENEWIQVETEMHYTHHGTFCIRMTRIRDGKVLVDKSFSSIDMWRKGAVSIRNKFGIYRSFGKTMEGEEDRPANGIKDETLQLADFKVYEAHTNANPQPHD